MPSQADVREQIDTIIISTANVGYRPKADFVSIADIPFLPAVLLELLTDPVGPFNNF